MLRCHFTSIENPIVEIRLSYDRLISTVGITILVRRHIYIESGPRAGWEGVGGGAMLAPWTLLSGYTDTWPIEESESSSPLREILIQQKYSFDTFSHVHTLGWRALKTPTSETLDFGSQVTPLTLQYLWSRPPGVWLGWPGCKPAGGHSGPPTIKQPRNWFP